MATDTPVVAGSSHICSIYSIGKGRATADTAPGYGPNLLRGPDVPKGICSIDGCERTDLVLEWCSKHYQRVKKHGTAELPRRLSNEERFWPRVDKTEDCWLWTGAMSDRERIFFWGDRGASIDAVRFSYELHRGRKLGRTERARRTCKEKRCVRPDHLVATPAERFWSKVEKTDECWNWTGNLSDFGYGMFTIGGKNKFATVAHRWSYMQVHGPIPEDMQIDHICFNRACVNPDHLRQATGKQNLEHQRTYNRKSASGIRGVFPKDGLWRAGVRHNGKLIYAGYFSTPEEADEAARELRLQLYTHNDEDRGAA